MCAQIDRISKTNSTNGSQGGRPKTESDESGESEKSEANRKKPTVTVSVTESNTVTVTDTGEPPTPTPPVGGGKGAGKKPSKPKEAPIPKTQYAEFVSMTNDEHSSLVTKLGEEGTVWCIKTLDNYKGSHGKKYASDYRTILSWVVRRYEEERGQGRNNARVSNKESKVTGVTPPNRKVDTMDILQGIIEREEGVIYDQR